MLPIVERNPLQHQAASFPALAMAADAVLIDESNLACGGRCSTRLSGRRCRHGSG
jgi:hypothetical protein